MKDIAFIEKELKTWLDSFTSSEVVRLYEVGNYDQEEGAEELGNAVSRFLNSSNHLCVQGKLDKYEMNTFVILSSFIKDSDATLNCCLLRRYC